MEALKKRSKVNRVSRQTPMAQVSAEFGGYFDVIEKRNASQKRFETQFMARDWTNAPKIQPVVERRVQ